MSDKPAYRTWKKRLPGFLRNYALSNGIEEVHLFFGSSTHYLKAAQAAVESLLKEKLIAYVAGFKFNSQQPVPPVHIIPTRFSLDTWLVAGRAQDFYHLFLRSINTQTLKNAPCTSVHLSFLFAQCPLPSPFIHITQTISYLCKRLVNYIVHAVSKSD